jgi:hypothetical protein
MKAPALLFALLFSFSFLAFSGQVEFIYHFNPPSVTKSGDFQAVNFENTLLTALPGQPAIPYQPIKLMLPPGESAQSIEITFSDETVLPGKFYIYPQQEVQPVSGGIKQSFIKDEAVYSSNASYPADPKGHMITSFLNGRAFALSTFTPVRYNPVTGVVSYYKTVKVTVLSEPSEDAQKALSNLSSGNNQAVRFADNSEMDSFYAASRKPTTDNYELLIICTSAYSGAFDGYRAAYLKEGLRSQLITLETITSTMSGVDVPEKMRNYIIQEYQAHGIQHVLLAGDAELMPYRGFYCYVQSGGGYTDSNIPSDIYFSALDRTWNTDNDALWAEPGEEDLLPEISVGRLPFSNLAELNSMLHKSYSYQFTPVDGEFRNVLMAGEYLYPAPYYTQGSIYMELLIGQHTDHGYTTTGIPANYTFDKLYDVTAAAAWLKQDLMNHMNMGRPMLNHVGHANYQTMMRMGMADITNQNFSGLNGTSHNYTVAYTHGCNCGGFDWDDCIAERTVTIDNFAVGIIANSRYGWFNEGTSEGPSAHIHREFMDALFHDKINRLGSAHTQSKIASAPWVTAPGQWEPGALRWCFYDCTVLGDPAMAVFTDNPMTVKTVYSGIASGATSMVVTVTFEGSAVAGLSCVVLEEGVMLGKATTNASGEATLALSPEVGNINNVQLVVSGYNCVPVTYNLITKTYTWNTASGNWNAASSWSPTRTAPAANDILIFDGNSQASPAITTDFTSAENIGRLQLINNANVNLVIAPAARTINIGTPGSDAPQLEITAGSTLNVSATNPVLINLPVGNVASISGDIVFQNGAHRLTASSENGIAFNNGATFTAGNTFTGNPFGTATSNSVLFADGSSYIHNGVNNPFGKTAPESVVVFNTGSSYKFTAASGAPDLSGRIYGNLEINSPSTDLNSMSGSGTLTVQDLAITSGNCGFSLSETINLKGNVAVASGQSLNFNPPSLAIVNLNGISAQLISGQGSIDCNANSTVNSVNPAGVTLNNAVTFNNFIVSSGDFTIAPGASLITSGSVYGTVKVERTIANDNGWHFISSPVISQVIQPAFAPLDMNNTFDFYRWDPAENLSTGLPWVNLRNSSSGLNLDFDPLNNKSPEFKTGSGYLVAYSPGYINPGGNGITKTFSGTLHNGAISKPIFNDANPWNLIGNPYPSSLDFDKFNTVTGSKLVDAAYWTALSDGSYASYAVGSGGIKGATKNIAPMQGFFVQASATKDVDFTNEMRLHSDQPWLKNGQEIPDQLRLELTNAKNSLKDEILIHRSAVFDGTTGAEKLMSMKSDAANLFTIKSGKNFCIDQVAENTEKIVLGLMPYLANNYTITLTSNSFPASEIITIEDLKTGKKQDLKKEPVYSFSALPGDEINRFILHFKSTNGISEEVTKNGIRVYVSGKTINIKQTTLQKGMLHVYNATGQLVETKSLSALLSQSINLGHLPAGIYLMQINSGKEFYSGKVTIR